MGDCGKYYFNSLKMFYLIFFSFFHFIVKPYEIPCCCRTNTPALTCLFFLFTLKLFFVYNCHHKIEGKSLLWVKTSQSIY